MRGAQRIVNEVCNLGRVTSGSVLRWAENHREIPSFVIFCLASRCTLSATLTQKKMHSTKQRKKKHSCTDLMKQNVTLKFLHQANTATTKKSSVKWGTKSPAWFPLTQHQTNQWNNNSQKTGALRKVCRKKIYFAKKIFCFLVLLILLLVQFINDKVFAALCVFRLGPIALR